MAKNNYHHGNLKNELIEKGLEYIDKNGVESLSLRKLADAAGVSCAAPYSHFKNKEDFLTAIQDYITERFMDVLTGAAEFCNDKSRLLIVLGISYVRFFYENPLYYSFLFDKRCPDLELYSPFLFFRECVTTTVGKDLDEEHLRYTVIALWSMVHGLAGLITHEGVADSKRIPEEIEKIITSVEIRR
jgi:AcrR family transcriptional regulator